MAPWLGKAGYLGVEVRLKRVDACPLYFAGLSYRDIAYVLKYVKVSHEAVRKWVKRLSS